MTESKLNFDPATQAEIDALPKALVIRDDDGNLVGRFMGLIGSESGPALVMYQGNPADADFFGAFPLVTVQLEPDKFVAGRTVKFENPDCDEAGEIYIDFAFGNDVFGLPRITVVNDPVIGAVAYVPIIPVTPVGSPQPSISSFLSQSGLCTNTSGAAGGVFGQAVELGLFPPYSLSD